ncbi:AMP-binding protein [Exiguobacterium sp.]|uniref:AMP-binding protein n=1 Tax=Exiguobacterium sp. TaxID=44751 RepID=UPI00289B41D4|nr:AMP-binding protein [Exiguobacterium sp.]
MTITSLRSPLLETLTKITKQTPMKEVLLTEGATYTLEDIRVRSNAMARQLEKSFMTQQYIPVYTTDNIQSIFSMLACWKAGKVYVPLNPQTPAPKIRQLMSTLHCESIWTDGLPEEYDMPQVIFSKERMEHDVNVTGTDVAYILMTSGSTGEPKKVEVTHTNLDWLLRTLEQTIPFGENDRFLVSTPPAFDVVLHEMLAFLYGQGRVVCFPAYSNIQKIKELPNFVNRYDVTHIALSPSACTQILNRENERIKLSSLRKVLLAGEALGVPLVQKLHTHFPNVDVYNLYGPTETTVYATCLKIDKGTNDEIPIGKVLDGASIVFRDEQGQLNDTTGEILIGGNGVSRGYLGNPSLTEEKFLTIDGARYYATGDHGRKDENDIIFYEGRQDDQVQVNGIRVELGEINAALHSIHPTDTFETLYLANRLVVFSDTHAFTVEDTQILKEELKKRIPSYMIPSMYVTVPEFKITANRKLDRRYLESFIETKELGNLIEKQSNQEIDQLVARISDHYGRPVTPDMNLIHELHLDSLDQLDLLLLLEDHFNVTLVDDFVVMYPTLRQVQTQLSREEEPVKNIIEVDESYWNGIVEDNMLANRARYEQATTELKETFYLQKSYHVDGFRQVLHEVVSIPERCDRTQLQESINTLIARHPMLRSFLTVQEDRLQFSVHEETASFRLLSVPRVTEEQRQNWIDRMKQHYLEDLMAYFVHDVSTNRVELFINHHIADQASMNILKQDLSALLQGKTLLPLTIDYWDYIHYIDANRNRAELEIEQVSRAGFSDVTSDVFDVNEGRPVRYLSFQLKRDTPEEYIAYANYIILGALAAGQSRQQMSGSTIVDLRSFDGLDIKGVVGDVHTTIPLCLERGESFETFNEKFDGWYKQFESGINFNHLLYRDYPRVQDMHRTFEHDLDDNLKVSSSFLGAIREQEIPAMLEELKASHAILQNFSTHKLYASIFYTGKQLIIVPLSQPILSEEFITRLGGVIHHENKSK